MIQIEQKNDWIVITGDNDLYVEVPSKWLEIRKKYVNSTDYTFYIIEKDDIQGLGLENIPFTDIAAVNGEFTDQASFDLWTYTNLSI